MNDLLIAVVAVVVLLLTREIWTWFLKQNKIVTQNTEIIRLLRKIVNEPEPQLPGEKLSTWLRRKKH